MKTLTWFLVASFVHGATCFLQGFLPRNHGVVQVSDLRRSFVQSISLIRVLPRNVCLRSSLNESNNSLENINDGDSNFSLLSDDVIMIIGLSSIKSIDDAMESMRSYIRKYPFSVVLPVQPLNYLPSETGVDVTFLRKKTQGKGSKDGGMAFDVIPSEINDESSNDSTERCRFQLIGKRVTEGQSISKVFSEKTVVNSIVKSLDGDQDDVGVRVESIFHRWL